MSQWQLIFSQSTVNGAMGSSPKFPVKAQGVEHPLLAHIKQRPLEQRIALPSQLATAGVA